MNMFPMAPGNFLSIESIRICFPRPLKNFLSTSVDMGMSFIALEKFLSMGVDRDLFSSTS